MDIVVFNTQAGTAFYAYVDNLPRGFGFHSESGYSVLRMGRLVLEWGA